VENYQFKSCYRGTTMGNFQEKSIVDYGVITNHFGLAKCYKEVDAQQLIFKKNLLFVAKVYLPSFIMESQWLRRLVMRQNPQVAF
jgi:hypothetical protein